ncbi:MAG: hypothetical protein VX624_08695, partial [Pseudomonadota bacterium]|nr:hypothetical protein [Pseudomonadota bacterium]
RPPRLPPHRALIFGQQSFVVFSLFFVGLFLAFCLSSHKQGWQTNGANQHSHLVMPFRKIGCLPVEWISGLTPEHGEVNSLSVHLKRWRGLR